MFVLAKINSVHPAQLTPMPSKSTRFGRRQSYCPKTQRSAECLLCKCEGLGYDPQKPHKKPGVAVHSYNPSIEEGSDRRVAGVCWLPTS